MHLPQLHNGELAERNLISHCDMELKNARFTPVSISVYAHPAVGATPHTAEKFQTETSRVNGLAKQCIESGSLKILRRRERPRIGRKYL